MDYASEWRQAYCIRCGRRLGLDTWRLLLRQDTDSLRIAEMTEEGHLLRQGKQFVLLEPFAGGESDSANQLKDRRSSYQESSRRLERPLFKRSLLEKNGRLPVSPVVPPLSKRGPNGLRI